MPDYDNWDEADPAITAMFKFRNEEIFDLKGGFADFV